MLQQILLIALITNISTAIICIAKGECLLSHGESTVCPSTGFQVMTKLPKNITRLYFNGNNITVLEGGQFENLTQLIYLNLRKNRIVKLTNSAFVGLAKLQELDLKDNFIRIIEKDAFAECSELRSIDFSKNYVIRLKAFAVAMAPLIHLQKLDFTQNKLLEIIEDGELLSMNDTNLTDLVLTECQLRSIDRGALSSLHKLQRLVLSWNLLSEDQIANAVWNLTMLEILEINSMELPNIPTKALKILQNSRLRVLQLQDNNLRKLLKYTFPPLPLLQELKMQLNEISEMDELVFKNLTSLQDLDISRNRYIAMEPAIPNIRTLKSLDLTANTDRSMPNVGFSLGNFMFANMSQLESLILNLLRIETLERYSLFGLSNLKTLEISYSLNSIEEYCFETLSNLEILKLNGNRIISISPNMFYGLQGLKTLHMNNCELKLDANITNFYHSPNLVRLTLTENLISFMPYSNIANLTNLEFLQLEGNSIVPWNVPVLHGKNLSMKSLLLSRNTLYTVTPSMLLDFQSLRNLTITENPFNCSLCDMNDFAIWLGQSDIIDNRYNIVCVAPKTMWGKSVMELTLPSYCVLDTSLTLTIALACAGAMCCVFLIAAIVGYHFRWYIRYFWFLSRAKVHDMANLGRENNFKYDAFISYNEKDRDWLVQNMLPKLEAEEPRLSLCLHERDFVIGKEIVSNIIESIDCSRKVVLLLTDNFLASQWCTWEMNMAQFKLVDDCRDALVLIMLEKIEKKKMSSSLRYLIRTRTYLEWVENPQGQKLFWERLKYSLKKPEKNQQQKLV